MSRIIVFGFVTDLTASTIRGNSFWCLNGDIEIDEDGDEVYICNQWVAGSGQYEDVYTKTKYLPLAVQCFIAENKEIDEED